MADCKNEKEVKGKWMVFRSVTVFLNLKLKGKSVF